MKKFIIATLTLLLASCVNCQDQNMIGDNEDIYIVDKVTITNGLVTLHTRAPDADELKFSTAQCTEIKPGVIKVTNKSDIQPLKLPSNHSLKATERFYVIESVSETFDSIILTFRGEKHKPLTILKSEMPSRLKFDAFESATERAFISPYVIMRPKQAVTLKPGYVIAIDNQQNMRLVAFCYPADDFIIFCVCLVCFLIVLFVIRMWFFIRSKRKKTDY